MLQEQEFERVGGTRTIKVDVRVIAATNRDLPAMVEAGQFREDLYYRLNVVTIEMPPLRERKDDIPRCRTSSSAVRRRAEEEGRGPQPRRSKLLMRYHWPGNIRELENAIERAVLIAEGPQIADRRPAPRARPGRPERRATTRRSSRSRRPGSARRDRAHRLIEALKMSNWVQKDAAELLAISPRVMNYKIKTLGIDFPRDGARRAARQRHAPKRGLSRGAKPGATRFHP